MKTREEVDELKRQWKRDPIWDIEETEDFEEYREELVKFHEECRIKREVEREKENKKWGGGPAFPCNSPDGFEAYKGMTLRDWYAGQALVGIINSDCSFKMDVERRAELAYRVADAMIAQREKDE